MEEVRKWQIISKKQPAMYVGLVQDHNNNWASEFKKTPTTYETMLDAIVKELQEELYNLEPPSIKDMAGKKEEKKKKKKTEVI